MPLFPPVRPLPSDSITREDAGKLVFPGTCMSNAVNADRLILQFSVGEGSPLPEIRNDVAFIASAVNIAGTDSAELDRKNIPEMQNKRAVIPSHLPKIAQFVLWED